MRVYKSKNMNLHAISLTPNLQEKYLIYKIHKSYEWNHSNMR